MCTGNYSYMEVKEEEPDSFYETSLEPDVILIDSDDSNESNDHNLLRIKAEVTPESREIGHRRPSLTSTDSGPLRQCPTCKKYFKRLSSHMYIHEERADPERPFPCSYCPKVFKNLSNLTVHTRSHTGFRPYVCDICNKGFTQSGNLVHHQRIHTGLRPYKCPVCDRAFTQPGNLGNHLRLHSQEKPFQCHICERSFTQSSNLNSHMRNNHKELFQEQIA